MHALTPAATPAATAPARPLDQNLRATGLDGRLFDGLSALWVRVSSRHLVRPVAVPSGVRVVVVGGATLGGSGKTPLAIACAAELAASGARVVLVGHAYRAKPGYARVVAETDTLDDVGDEALLAARALALLEPSGRARVVVAPRRSDAVELALRHADVLVIDGVAQTKPRRASLALLAVDSSEPWGRVGALPPRGDLRAPVAALLSVCDAVVAVGERGVASGVAGALEGHVVSKGVCVEGETLAWSDLRGVRVGLLSALARPERVIRSLALRGIVPRAVLASRDHGPMSHRLLERASTHRVDLWLATPKCALHVDAAARVIRPRIAPVATIGHALALSRGAKERLRAVGVS